MLYMYMYNLHLHVHIFTERKANMERERKQKSSRTHQPWYLCNVSSMLLQLKLVCNLFHNVVDAMVKSLHKYIFFSLSFYLIIILNVRFPQCNSRIIYIFFLCSHVLAEGKGHNSRQNVLSMFIVLPGCNVGQQSRITACFIPHTGNSDLPQI